MTATLPRDELIAVYCGERRKDGRVCNALLGKVRCNTHWAWQTRCHSCGNLVIVHSSGHSDTIDHN